MYDQQHRICAKSRRVDRMARNYIEEHNNLPAPCWNWFACAAACLDVVILGEHVLGPHGKVLDVIQH
jgi:hypothetical protein